MPSSISMRDIPRLANELVSRQNFAAAEELLEKAISANPTDARLHLQLASCHAAANQLHLAIDRYRDAVNLDPSLAHAHAGLAGMYLFAGMVDVALKSSATAVTLAPADPHIALCHVRILEAAGQSDAAWNLTQNLIRDNFITPMAVRLYARMARFRDQQANALVLTLKLLEGKKSSVWEQELLHFAAADLLDSLGRYDEAFTHTARANAMARRPYDPAAQKRNFDRLIAYFTADRLKRLSRSTETSAKPVFIVGMPRSGTSLVEQMLASHPEIYGAGELDFVERVLHGTVAMLGCKPSQYPNCLDHLTVDQATGMAQIYLQPLIALSPGSARITDKLPLNFLHLGLINLLMPGARVIHCQRDPIDTCLSCHINGFMPGHNFKFDLTHLGLFHRQYQRLMTHWAAVLDLKILNVCYEDLVADPQSQIQRMLGFLEVPYDSRCLDFHERDRPVLTSSMEQVRQPLYLSSVHRWKHYQKHLAPLRDALGLLGDES